MSRSKDELILHARLIPVGRDLTAKAGQRIIVVAGLAVAVYTGDEHVPLLEKEEPHKAAALVQAVPTQPRTKSEKAQANHRPSDCYRLKDGSPISTLVPVLDCIRRVLAALPPDATCSRLDICAAIGIDANSKEEWKIRAANSLLLDQGEMVKLLSGTRIAAYKAGPNLQRASKGPTHHE